jgi:hypothetical protein
MVENICLMERQVRLSLEVNAFVSRILNLVKASRLKPYAHRQNTNSVTTACKH